jgi:hypothetical protein
MLVVSFVTTVHLRSHEVEDETISRLAPALCAVHFATVDGTRSNFVVTMEPLIIQMYAGPATRVIDLESVDSDTLETLMSPSEDSHVDLREGDRQAVK